MPKVGTASRSPGVPTTPAAQATAPAPVRGAGTSLRRGATGAQVLELQRRLMAVGVDTGPLDGRFGPLTEAAVRAFQRRRGLAVDGVVGPETGRALERRSASRPCCSDQWLPTTGGLVGPHPRRATSAPPVLPPRAPVSVSPSAVSRRVDNLFGALARPDSFDGGGRGDGDGPLLAPPPAQTSTGAELPRHPSAFVNAVAPGAVDTMHRYGVPASVTLAQAVLESGWGESHLAQKANNLFGIKGRGPAGSVTVRTREYLDGKWQTVEASFRAYRTPAESIEDHGRLLATSRYYREAMKRADEPKAFARTMGAVYATDPKYADRLVGLMDRHGLERFDVC